MKEEKRLKIIDAARTELLRTGGSGFSLNQVLTNAGGSKTTLYTYFGGRDGLLKAVLLDVMNETFQQENSPLPSQPKPFLQFIARVTYKAVFSDEAIAIYRMAISEAPSSPELAKVFLQTGPQVARQMLSQSLKDFHRQKKLKVKDADMAADVFFGMILETPVLYCLLKLPLDDQEERIDEAVRVFLTAYSI